MWSARPSTLSKRVRGKRTFLAVQCDWRLLVSPHGFNAIGPFQVRRLWLARMLVTLLHLEHRSCLRFESTLRRRDAALRRNYSMPPPSLLFNAVSTTRCLWLEVRGGHLKRCLGARLPLQFSRNLRSHA